MLPPTAEVLHGVPESFLESDAGLKPEQAPRLVDGCLRVEHIAHALRLTGGHRSQTAELLGISRKVLWEKIRDFGIQVPGAASPGPEDVQENGRDAAAGDADGDA